MNNFDQFKTPESTQEFFQGIPDNCRDNILDTLGNFSGGKKLLQYFLWQNWTKVFGYVDKEFSQKLTIEELLLGLEIISETEYIPHGFNTLLSTIFRDESNQNFEQMRDPKYCKRTAVCIQNIFEKTLKNPRSIGTYKYEVTEGALNALREQKIDYSNYQEAKSYREKYESLTKKYEDDKRKEIGELVDSWY